MEKILIIDDDTFICEILKKHLQNHNYKVEIAFTGKTALEHFGKQDFALVLCDYRLPNTSGLEILQKMKAIKPEIPVIIMTAYADVRMAVQLMKMGAHDYITKPIQQEELLSLIKSTLKNDTGRNKNSIQKTFVNGDFVMGESPQIKHILSLVQKVAPTNMSVIIEGETGTGKEYIARYIHENSLRKNKPFMAIDCGAIPKDIANSELFGHVKGAFTGALIDKDGLFQKADGGTLFLDEIGNLTYDIQLKLLRSIQERVVSKIGENKLQKIDIRIITATNEDLLSEVRQNTFREDLYHRINEFKIKLLPLRERSTDILVFVDHFLNMANKELNREITGITPDVKEIIMNYPWYGNLRELKNVIKRSVLMAAGNVIDRSCLPDEIVFPTLPNNTDYNEKENESNSILKNASSEIEKQLIVRTIQEAGYNKSKAAKILKIDRKTLYNKIKLYDIDL
jgi:two-component system response regulator HydG